MNGKNLPLCPDWRFWIASGALALIALAWLSISGLTVDLSSFPLAAPISAICLAWFFAGRFVSMRDGPRALAAGLAFSMLAGVPLSILSPLLMTIPAPLADAALAEWDTSLGFDWVAYLSWVVVRPWLADLLLWTYHAILPASFLTFFVLHFVKRERASEYIVLSFIAGLITILIGAAFPAVGAPTYFRADMTAFPTGTGTHWVQQLIELRSGAPMEIGDLVGMVTFPSYHVAHVMIMAWSFRGIRIAFPLFVAYTVGTAASAPIIGGHYFVDLIGGAALVCAMIAVANLRRTSRPALSTPLIS